MNIRSMLRTAVQEVRGYWQGPFTLNNPNVPLSAFWGDGGSTSAGITVSESVALTYSAFYSAVALISGDNATLPLHLYLRESNGGRRRITNHPLARVLDIQANKEQSALTVREMLTVHALMGGNGFAEVARNRDGQVVALYPIEPNRVTPVRDANGTLQYRVWNPSGGDVFLAERNVFHLRGMTLDGVLGVSVVAAARQSIGLGLAAETFGATFFRNGLNVGGFLKHPGKLDKTARQAIRESLAARHEGAANAHRWLILQDGMTAEQIGLSPEDSQFLESRVFGVQEICRWFHLPPTKLADFSRATYSNSEQSNADYYSSCLRRMLSRWEAEISSKLVDGDELFAEFKVDAILRGDITARYAAYKAGREAGFLTANECRQFENLPPLPGADTLLQPLNHTTIGGPSEPTRADGPLFQPQGLSAAVLTSHRDLLVDVYNRYIRRETERARRHQTTGEKLRQFARTYYDAQQMDLWTQMMKPALRAWHAVAGLDVDIDAVCTALATAHMEQSKRELLDVADVWGDENENFGAELQRRLEAWETDRAQRVVDHLLAHGAPASVEPPRRNGSLGVNMADAMLKLSAMGGTQ